MMRSSTRGRPALLAMATRCTYSPKRSRAGMATPARPLLENLGPRALRSPARACARPAPPADGAGRSCGRCASERNRRWRGRQTSRQKSQKTAPIGNQTGSSESPKSPRMPVFMRVLGIVQGRPLMKKHLDHRKLGVRGCGTFFSIQSSKEHRRPNCRSGADSEPTKSHIS